MSFRKVIESVLVSSDKLLCEAPNVHPQVGNHAQSTTLLKPIMDFMSKNGIVAHVRWFLPNYSEYAVINKVYVTPSSDVNDESIVYELFLEKDTEKTTPIMVSMEDLKKISHHIENKYMERTALQKTPKWFYNGASDLYSQLDSTKLTIDGYNLNYDASINGEKLNTLLQNAQAKDDAYSKLRADADKWTELRDKAKIELDADESNTSKQEKYKNLSSIVKTKSKKADEAEKEAKESKKVADAFSMMMDAYVEPSSLFAVFEFKEKGMPTGWYVFDGVFATEVPETRQKFYAWKYEDKHGMENQSGRYRSAKAPSETLYTTTLEGERYMPIDVYAYTTGGMKNIVDIYKNTNNLIDDNTNTTTQNIFSLSGDILTKTITTSHKYGDTTDATLEYVRDVSADKEIEQPKNIKNMAKITFVRPYGETSQHHDIGKEFYLSEDEIGKLTKIDFYPISDKGLEPFLDFSYKVEGRSKEYFIIGYNNYLGYLLDTKINDYSHDKLFTAEDVDKIEKNRIYVKTRNELFQDYISNNPNIIFAQFKELNIPEKYAKIGAVFENAATKEKFIISSISVKSDPKDTEIVLLPKSGNDDEEGEKLTLEKFQKDYVGLSKEDIAKKKLAWKLGEVATKSGGKYGAQIASKNWFIPGYGPVKFISGDDNYAKFDAQKAKGIRISYRKFTNDIMPLEENLANRVALFFGDSLFDILSNDINQNSESYRAFSDIKNSTPIVLQYVEDTENGIVCTISDVVLQDSEFQIVFNRLSDKGQILMSKKDLDSDAKIVRGKNIDTFAKFSGIPDKYRRLSEILGVFFPGENNPFVIDVINPDTRTVEVLPVNGKNKSISMSVEEFNSNVSNEPLNEKIIDFLGETNAKSAEVDVIKKYLDQSQVRIEGYMGDFSVLDFGGKSGQIKRIKLGNEDNDIVKVTLEEYATKILEYNDLLNSDSIKRVKHAIKKYEIAPEFAQNSFYIEGEPVKYKIIDIKDDAVQMHWVLSTSVVPSGAQEYYDLSIDEFKQKATFDEPSSYFWKKQQQQTKPKDGYNSARTDKDVEDYIALKFLVNSDIHPAVWETRMPVLIDDDLFIIKKVNPTKGTLELVNATKEKDARNAADKIVVSADEYIDKIIFGIEENRISYEEHLKDWVGLRELGELFSYLEEKEKDLAKEHNTTVDDAIQIPEVQQALRKGLLDGIRNINGNQDVKSGSYLYTMRKKKSPSYKTQKATTITYDKDTVKSADDGKHEPALAQTPDEWFERYNIDTKYLKEPIKILGNNYFFSDVERPNYNDVRGPVHFVFKPEIPKEILNNPFLANSADVKKAYASKKIAPGELLKIISKMNQ